MASRKKFISLDYHAFEDQIHVLKQLSDDYAQIVADAMEEAAKQIQDDTHKALAPANLPAKGAFSNGKTEESVVADVRPQITGTKVSVGLGFDKTMPGAGGWLITGTPKMNPDKALEKIYRGRKYEKDITKAIQEKLNEAIKEKMDGR